MAIDPRQAFQNGVSACYDPTQIQALYDAYCFPCASDSSPGGGCFKILPSGTPSTQFAIIGWGNQQPNPALCPFLGVVVDCTLWVAPNDPSCNFTDPNIWIQIGAFISAPKAQFTFQMIGPLGMTPDDAWFTLPLGVQDFNSMTTHLSTLGDQIILVPGSYVIQSSVDFHLSQGGTEMFSSTRLFNVTAGLEVKKSNRVRISGLGGAAGPINRVEHSVHHHFRVRVSPTVITTYRIEHSTSGSDPGDYKYTAGNNELYIERDK